MSCEGCETIKRRSKIYPIPQAGALCTTCGIRHFDEELRAAEFEYVTETVSGNCFDVAKFMNQVASKKGWELISVDVVGYYSICIMKRKLGG